MSREIRIIWLYPNILNIHGGRGDLMALKRTGEIMGMSVKIRRCESYADEIPFEWADIVYLTSGEIKCMPEVVKALGRQKEQLGAFLEKGGCLWAIGSSGAVLGKRLEQLDGGIVEGLGLLGAIWKERTSVWGDDLWFSVREGMEVMGNQIQVADIHLDEGQEPFGNVIYGRGNCGDGGEGARKGNVIHTNCLGPMMVKNPRIAAMLLKAAAEHAGVKEYRELAADDISMEEKSFELIRKFIEKKRNGGR